MDAVSCLRYLSSLAILFSVAGLMPLTCYAGNSSVVHQIQYAFCQSEFLDGYNKSHKQFQFRLHTGLRNSRSSLRQSTVKAVDID